jgi:hypothetical protein
MPTIRTVINLLNTVPNMSNAIFRDTSGNLPVIKTLNRLGNVVYTIPNDNVQIVYRILMYDALDSSQDMLAKLTFSPQEYRWGLPFNRRIRVERQIQTDWSSRYSSNDNRPRKLTGLKFIVDVPNRGAWGRYQPYTTRTAPVVNDKITLSSIQNTLREITAILDRHTANEDERQMRQRIERENYRVTLAQADIFMKGILEHYPLERDDDYSWRNNYTNVCLHLVLEKHQVAKVLDAIHHVRSMQTNPLDVEYLLKKDY